MPVTPRVLARRRSESAVSEGMPERERKGVRAAPGVAWLGVADGAREPCTNAHGVGARQLHLCHDRTMPHVAAAKSAAAVVSCHRLPPSQGACQSLHPRTFRGVPFNRGCLRGLVAGVVLRAARRVSSDVSGRVIAQGAHGQPLKP